VAAATTALVALFLTPLFRNLPEAALGAIVIIAVSSMERIGPLRRLWRLRRSDCVLALVALFAVLIFQILVGLAIAVALSIGLIVWHASQARLEVPGRRAPSPDDTSAKPPSRPGLLVVRPQEMLFFVNAAQIRDAVLATTADEAQPPDVVLLDLALTPDLDVPALDALADIRDLLKKQASRLWIVTEVDVVLHRLQLAGLTDADASDVYENAAGGMLSYLATHSTQGEPGHRTVLRDLLEYIDKRLKQTSLDESGRIVLDALEAQVRDDLAKLGGEGP
jgi:sulfate permease, SulP family